MSIPTPRMEETGEGSQSLVLSIKERLETIHDLSKKCCIYRVPKYMRQLNEKSFTPAFVSIGPFHYKNNVDLLPMEHHKHRCLQYFLNNAGRNKDLNHYVQIIMDKEAQIRESYAEPIPLSSDEFIRMVLFDSAFIIQLFMDEIPMPFISLLVGDLQLAENQLPFFILKDLYMDAFSNTSPSGYFTDIACRFLGLEKSRIKVDDTTNEADCLHLLDMIRTYHLPTLDDQKKDNPNVDKERVTCHTATSLHEAGVKFHVDSTPNRSFLDIRFDTKKGNLTIPKRMFGDDTESQFRNLIAFEHCHYLLSGEPTYFADYQFLFSELINSTEDVKLLVKEGVIENWMGSEKDVSNMINSFGIQVYPDSDRYIYRCITKQLNDHCNKSWNHYNATLKHAFF